MFGYIIGINCVLMIIMILFVSFLSALGITIPTLVLSSSLLFLIIGSLITYMLMTRFYVRINNPDSISQKNESKYARLDYIIDDIVKYGDIKFDKPDDKYIVMKDELMNVKINNKELD